MPSKVCFKCNETKGVSFFYKHRAMGDGYLGKCKECTKKDVIANRIDKVDYYREYDRERGNRQEKGYLREYREKFPKKYRATSLVAKAIRQGHLHPEPCEVCGSREYAHGHHDDYDKPLNVRWLCAAHHKQWHVENEPINGV